MRKTKYCKCIVYCSETFTERSQYLTTREETLSNYKNKKSLNN